MGPCWGVTKDKLTNGLRAPKFPQMGKRSSQSVVGAKSCL
jgi:hypothetical protein